MSPEKVTGSSGIGPIRLAAMDEAGIAMQILSLGLLQQVADTSLAIELARKCNDSLAQHIQEHPDRFAGLAALPTQDGAAAAGELERAVAQLGYKGALLTGRASGKFLDADEYRVLWERAAAPRAPIYLHPGSDE